MAAIINRGGSLDEFDQNDSVKVDVNVTVDGEESIHELKF